MNANTLVFIEISSRSESHVVRVSAGTGMPRGCLDTEIVFETEDGGPEEHAGNKFADGCGGESADGRLRRRAAVDGGSLSGIAGVGLLEGLNRAVKGRTLRMLAARSRAAGSVRRPLMHDGSDGGLRAGQGGQPDGGESNHKDLPHPPVVKFDQEARMHWPAPLDPCLQAVWMIQRLRGHSQFSRVSGPFRLRLVG